MVEISLLDIVKIFKHWSFGKCSVFFFCTPTCTALFSWWFEVVLCFSPLYSWYIFFSCIFPSFSVLWKAYQLWKTHLKCQFIPEVLSDLYSFDFKNKFLLSLRPQNTYFCSPGYYFFWSLLNYVTASHKGGVRI